LILFRIKDLINYFKAFSLSVHFKTPTFCIIIAQLIAATCHQYFIVSAGDAGDAEDFKLRSERSILLSLGVF
jgi:hypothetical protein